MQRAKRDILKTGFKDVVMTTTAQAPGKTELEELIKSVAPVIYFHPDEQCFPVAVEWYLNRTWLVNDATRSRIPANPVNLPQGKTDSSTFYLDPKEGISMLKNQPLKAYVHAKPYSTTFTDLQYWFFYAYAGGATALVKWLIDEIKGHEGKINLKPLGSCNGTWGKITLRINNATREIEQVHLPQVRGDVWLPAKQFQKRGNQIMVYASKNNALFYSEAGVSQTEKLKFNLFSSCLEFCFQDETIKGTALDFSGSCELVSADYLGEDKPAEPLWLNFQHNWGTPHPEYLTFSSIKRIILSTFGKTLEFLLSRDILDELVNYLLSNFTEECRRKSLGPKARQCWEGEE